MKILIGQSYFSALDPKEFKRHMPYPPLGPLYAAAILKELGHDIIFFDSMLAVGPGKLLRAIEQQKPDMLLIYDDEFNYLTKMCLSNMREAAISFIEFAKSLSISVVVYSSDATDFSFPYLKAGCDAIIYGEGEITLQEVVKAFEENQFNNFKKEIAGLKFLDAGKIYKTTSRKLISDLDSLPNPDYNFIDIDSYKNIWLKHHGYFSINISTTRGCPYNCNWCAKPLYGRSYTSRSPYKVVNQIKELKLNCGVEHIWMTDDIFGLKTNWIKEFSFALNQSGIKIPYKCLSRPDLLLRENTIQDLKNSGCRTIWVGAESGSQKILNAMDKGTRVEQIYLAAQKVHEAGMEISFFIQFGYLGEEWNDIRLTRKMIRENLPDDIGISVSYPLPGTVFYNRVKEQIKLKTNWKDSDDLDLLYTGNYERKFYKILHRYVHLEYRIIKIVRGREWKRFFHLIYYSLKFIFLQLKLLPLLKNEKTQEDFPVRILDENSHVHEKAFGVE